MLLEHKANLAVHLYLISILSCACLLQEETIKTGDDFLILASDGLWDVLSNQVLFRDVEIAFGMHLPAG